MPLYEYRCGQCGHEVELLRKLSDQSAIACPSCGATDMHKQVTAAGFQLKGTGWYATDFRNAGKAAPKAEQAGEGVAPASTDGKAEAAKPDAGAQDGAKAGSAKADGAKADGGSTTAPAATPPAGSAAGSPNSAG